MPEVTENRTAPHLQHLGMRGDHDVILDVWEAHSPHTYEVIGLIGTVDRGSRTEYLGWTHWGTCRVCRTQVEGIGLDATAARLWAHWQQAHAT